MKRTFTLPIWLKVGLRRKRIITLTGLWAILMAVVSVSTAYAGPPPVREVQVEARVDTQICASGAVQCSGPGHTYEAATDANHNPVRMFVLVSDGGEGISGLTATNFGFSDSLLPAGGGTAVFCSIATCGEATFREETGGGGLYSIFLDRGPEGNWRAGTYAGHVDVLFIDGGGNIHKGIALVTFTIPAQ